jgi:hypothetical protein
MVEQIRQETERMFWREVLVAEAHGEQLWPLRLRMGFKPPKDLLDYQLWVNELMDAAKPHRSQSFSISLSFRKSRSEVGGQSVPSAIYFVGPADFFGFLGRDGDLAHYRSCLEASVARTDIKALPALLAWMRSHPRKVLGNAAVWTELLAVCAYFEGREATPPCFIRELPIAVDTKFIERNAGILSELLPLVLPADRWRGEAKHFEDRLGLKRPEARVRCRLLDRALADAYLGGLTDVELPISDLAAARLGLHIDQILVAENLTSVEVLAATLPPTPATLVIWGAGAGAARLERIPWLQQVRRILYWGDMDAHGFAILASLRGAFPQAERFLMDEVLFDGHPHPSSGPRIPGSQLEAIRVAGTLDAAEMAFLERLNRDGLRLEQEKLSHQVVLAGWAALQG